MQKVSGGMEDKCSGNLEGGCYMERGYNGTENVSASSG